MSKQAPKKRATRSRGSRPTGERGGGERYSTRGGEGDQPFGSRWVDHALLWRH